MLIAKNNDSVTESKPRSLLSPGFVNTGVRSWVRSQFLLIYQCQELVLGRGDFKKRIGQITQRQTRPGLCGRPRVEEELENYYSY